MLLLLIKAVVDGSLVDSKRRHQRGYGGHGHQVELTCKPGVTLIFLFLRDLDVLEVVKVLEVLEVPSEKVADVSWTQPRYPRLLLVIVYSGGHFQQPRYLNFFPGVPDR